MPITGNLNQETSGLDESQRHFGSGDSTEVSDHIQASDGAGSEVSSTTVDPDPSAESAQMQSEDGGIVSESVQSTTSVDMSSDSLDGFKDSVPVIKESTVKVNTQYSKGFQDAFAAFASASFREEEEESPMDINDGCSSKNETVVSAAADSAGSVAVEPLVSSAIDSSLVTTTEDESFVKQGQDSEIAFVASDMTTIGQPEDEQVAAFPESETDPQTFVSTEQTQVTETVSESQTEPTTASDAVYFIQTTDASGQVVTSIIDPNDIPAYADSIVYKQCMLPDGDIETTIVSQGGVPVTQEEQLQEQVTASHDVTEQVEPQIIYVHDANGQLTPIDSAQSANDVAPPGKQFVYMQDSTGRIIRTIMDANQTMVPGQQVYYTQSEDGRIITSVMDSATAGVTEDGSQQTADNLYLQQTEHVFQTQEETQQQSNGTAAMVGGTAGFNIDNTMSGLSMLAELSHLTAGQASESRTTSSTESNSMDMDEFRPVAMVTRRVGEEGDAISSDIAGLKVGEADSSSLDQDQGSSLSQEDISGQEDSVISKLLAEMKTDLTPSHTVSRDNLFVQWQNLDAMCWMDVVLIMLVYSPTLRPLVNLDPTHELASTLLITLLKANRQAQVLLQNLLKKSNGAEISSLQTGAGNTASLQDPKTSKLVCKENMDEIGKAINILYAMREKIWQALQPRLRCERGKHNSPVLVLPLLVREKPAIKQMFTMNYRYVFKCEVCGYSQDDTHTKILPSIPAVPADFNMCTPSFVRNCFECQAPNQRMLMKFEGLQDFVQMHFVKGLPHNRFEELSFDFNEDHYEVTAVVHYKNNPDHFIAWVRNAPGNTWMECDDLKSVITRYQHMSPNIPPSQVHMVMWERRLTPQHTLIMRDTEDTKLLASLVLTVQQPNTHQSTDPASRPTGAPSTQSPMYTSQTNSLLGTNVQTFSTYPRGRGRGRGSRGGSYGTRGRGAASTTLMPVRRAAPTTVTQLTSPTSTTTLRARTTPQTIRVPLSSIPGAIRATTLGGDKIVLLSSNAQSSASTSTGTGTTSKVVVVRSQGGASNITAAQILQLLQRTGAITGGRVTTTINTSSSAAPVSQSYIIQPDGSVVSTSNATAETETSLQQVPAETVDTALAAEEQPVETAVETPMETNTDKSDPTDEEIGQVPTHAEHQISTLPFTASTPIRDQSSGTDTIVVSPEAVVSSATSEEMEQVSEVNSVLGQTQQPTRYIQIPNPSGSGTILTQLCMRGGKMVLIPVDKNTQAQLTGGSVLKLPNTPTNSPKIAIRAVNPQILSASSAGALLSQLQQQQQQLTLSQISSSNTSTVSTVGGQKRIALPVSAGQKKTIQVITVPASSSGQSITKKIVSPIGGQKGTSPAVSSTDGRILSQSGNILIREIKKGEGDSPTALSASLASPSQLISTPAVSLLKDVSSRSGTSLLSSAASQQKNQESFRYILQGSSTTHVLHTGTSTTQVNTGTTGRAFTALSSSGTIIGGQLTPSPTTSAIGTSPLDQDISFQENEDDTPALTPTRRLSREIDMTEYIPLGRGRAKTRGGRGRGRGGRTPRGRGRSQLWSTDTDYIPPSHPSRKISTLSADLRQIGAHVIESSAEAVDGVPVVSIPDYTAEEPNHQAEAESVAETLENVNSDSAPDSTLSAISELTGHLPVGEDSQENQLIDTSLSPQGPRVITQAIPSIKANHGFDILTQGILGSAATRSSLSQPKQARSLLTGSPVTIPATLNTAMSSATTILDASEMISAVSKMTHSASQAHTINTSEIDALIEAAQAAARPGDLESSPFAASPLVVNSKSPIRTLPINAEALGSPVKPVAYVSPPNDVSEVKMEDEQAREIADESETKEAMEEESIEKEARVVSFDESQVSAAERYRMPMELFQPDEESPEKPVKALTNDFPVKFFQDSEVTSQEDMSISPQVSPKGAARHRTISEVELDKKSSSLDSTVVSSSRVVQRNTNRTKLDFDSSFGDDVDIESTEKVVSKPKKAQDSKHSQKTIANENKRGRKKGMKTKKINNNNEPCIEGTQPAQSPAEETITTPKRESKPVRPKSTNIGGFATDLLMESELDEQTKIEQVVEEVEEKCLERVECENSVASEVSEEEAPDQETSIQDTPIQDTPIQETPILETPILDSHAVEEIEKQNVIEEKFESPKKHDVYCPANVCCKKIKIDWTVDEDGLAKMINQPRSFNYRVLQGILKTPHHRHSSLSRLQDIYISPPSPIYHVFKEKPVVHRPPIVIRRIPKALQRPAVDPSKEPTVIPLVAEDEGDPSYTGGSVVTSPVDGEIFNGVILKKKTEIADWSSCLEDGEEEDSLSDAVGDMKSAQHEYCEHLLTEFYIAAVSSGDYTYLDDLHECSHEHDTLNDSFEQEEKITSKHFIQCDSDQVAQPDSDHVIHELSEQVILKDFDQIIHQESNASLIDSPCIHRVSQEFSDTVLSSPDVSLTGSSVASPSITSDPIPFKKRRGRPKKNSTPKPETVTPKPKTVTTKSKAATPKSEAVTTKLEAVTLKPERVNLKTETENLEISVHSRLNGVESASSPQAATKPDTLQAQKDMTAGLASFPSPSRRSGRTPIPSKRVLDALEDSPARSALKGRRTSLVSSDDEHSGYSTGESVAKKVKKHVFTS